MRKNSRLGQRDLVSDLKLTKLESVMLMFGSLAERYKALWITPRCTMTEGWCLPSGMARRLRRKYRREGCHGIQRLVLVPGLFLFRVRCDNPIENSSGLRYNEDMVR